MSKHKKANLKRIIFFNLLTIIIFIGAAEIAARLYLHFTRGSSTIGMQERKLYLKYQPFVMFGPNMDRVLAPSKYPEKKDDVRLFRILLVGASTAAGFPESILESAFSKKFPDNKFEVINTAQGGYNARQELIVASVWGPNLEPDLIISLDGANDLTHRLRTRKAGTFFLNPAYELAIKRPFLSPFVHIMRHSQLVNAMYRLQNRKRIGSADEYLDAVPVYLSAQHSMNILAKGLAAARVMVLQPFIAFKEPLSVGETNFKHYEYREPVVKKLLSSAHEGLTDLAIRDDVLYIDGRFAFNGIKRTIFSDDVHFISDEGYHILAEHIVSFITEEDIKKL